MQFGACGHASDYCSACGSIVVVVDVVVVDDVVVVLLDVVVDVVVDVVIVIVFVVNDLSGFDFSFMSCCC